MKVAARLSVVLTSEMVALIELARGPPAARLGVQVQSRTPTVATLYGARLRGIGIAEALADVCGALPNARPIPEFREALRRLHLVSDEHPDCSAVESPA